MITVLRTLIHFEWWDAFHTLSVTIRERAVRISFAHTAVKRSGVENTGANPVTDGGGDLLRFNRPSCVRRKISSGARLRFITPTETPIFNRRGAPRSSSSFVCASTCMCECARVCENNVYAYVEKATLWDRHSLSLFLFLSSRFTSVHVHTSAIASLFAPCANCCILHAYVRSFSLSPFLFLSLSSSLLSSLLTCPFLTAYRLAFLTSRIIWLTVSTFSLAITLCSVVPCRMRNIIHNDALWNPMEFLYANIFNLQHLHNL